MKTNAAAIRAMSDEQLAEWLTRALHNGIEWFDAIICDRCRKKNGGACPTGDDPCPSNNSVVLEWLQLDVTLDNK